MQHDLFGLLFLSDTLLGSLLSLPLMSTSASQGKIVLVTGCTRGMGRKLVSHFACGGDNRVKMVIGVGHEGERMQSLRKEICQGQNKCRLMTAEVTNADQVQQVADQLKQEGIIPDILLNNAAVLGPVRPIWEVSNPDFIHCMQINIAGVQNFMRSFMPLMKDKQGAVLVNISSGWGRTAQANYGTYCCSKWAVEGLTKAAAADCENCALSCVTVAPGIIETDMLIEAGLPVKGVPLDEWIKTFPDLILGLNRSHNGQQLSYQQGGRPQGL